MLQEEMNTLAKEKLTDDGGLQECLNPSSGF